MEHVLSQNNFWDISVPFQSKMEMFAVVSPDKKMVPGPDELTHWPREDLNEILYK